MKFSLLYAGISFLWLSSCKNVVEKGFTIPMDTNGDTLTVVKKFCSQCHLSPDPGFLDKKTWENFVLPNMGCRLGLQTVGYSPYKNMEMLEQSLLEKTEVYPDKPRITESDWQKIVSYFLAKAPDEISIPPDSNKILEQFEILPLPGVLNIPRITMLYYDSMENMIDLGLESGMIITIDAKNWLVKDTVDIGTSPMNFATAQNGIRYLLTIGKMHPSEQTLGEVYNWEEIKFNKSPIINQLHRPVFLQFYNSPFNEHLLISEFGFETGKLSRFYPTQNKWQEYTSIFSKPGAVKTAIGDIDNDGSKEVISLLSQGDEQVISFKEKSKGRFESKILLRFHPLYGACDLDMADMNDDGFVDLVVSHGDNADYSIIVKPYHGINIYLNNGRGEFAESSFLPYPGVLHSELADFDQDGDIDIAATSFFPGDLQHPLKPFKYFMNEGNKFVSSSFEASEYGKWMNLVAGDFDADGDKDILLGSFLLNEKMLKGNHSDWRKHTLVLLKNKLK